MSIKTDNTQTLVNALAEIEKLRGRCAELEEALTWARFYVKDAWFRCGDNDQGETATMDKIDSLLSPQESQS